MFSPAYIAYLTSPHWSMLRRTVIRQANGRCEACQSEKRLDGHHLIYRDPLESCTEKDVMAICRSCHDIWHRWLDKSGRLLCHFNRKSTIARIQELRDARKAKNKLKGKALRKANREAARIRKEQLQGWAKERNRLWKEARAKVVKTNPKGVHYGNPSTVPKIKY